jgi:hypothetical protein
MDQLFEANRLDPHLRYVLELPLGNVYGCLFRNTCPTLLQGTTSTFPPHSQAFSEISVTDKQHFDSPRCMSL